MINGMKGLPGKKLYCEKKKPPKINFPIYHFHQADYRMTSLRPSNENKRFIRKYPIGTFIVLTFFITHVLNPIVVEGLHILFPGFSFSFPIAQLNHASLIAQYGPTLAAIFLVVKLYGGKGLRSTLRFSRLNGDQMVWLMVSVLLPLAMIVLSYSFAGVSLGVLYNTLSDNWQLYLLTIAGFIISAGLAEEYGWRGFLLPQLLRTLSPLKATILLFLILSLWHFPALLSGWKNEPLWPWLILSFSLAIIHAWLFFRSAGNLLVVILFHACFDAQYAFFSRFISGETLQNKPFHQGWSYVLSYAFLALLFIVITKGNLGYNRTKFDIDDYFGSRPEI